MLSVPLHSFFTKYIITSQNLKCCRYVRSIARRGQGPKLIEGKVRNTSEYEDQESFETYKDFVQSVRRSNLGDELEIEKQFLQEDYHGDVIERCDKFYGMHLRCLLIRFVLIKTVFINYKSATFKAMQI